MATRALSVWRPDPGGELGVAPDEWLPRLSTADAVRIADYLDAGAVLARTTARMADPWSDDTARRVPLTQRTDGVWRWDDALSYFVRHYNLSPGAEFVADVRSRGFAPPALTGTEVSAIIDEAFGGPSASTRTVELRLDGTQLLPRDYYCEYQGCAFRCDVDLPNIELIVSPGQSIPAGFAPKDDRGKFVQSIASKTVSVNEVSGIYRAITTCWYKGGPYSIKRIDGPQLRLSVQGGRRVRRTVPEPPRPTFDELRGFPNAETLSFGEVWATIDIVEAARVTMAIVPYHVVNGRLKPVRDVTGAGVAVPTADEIFYFPSPADSPYLPPGDAVAAVGEYLVHHDPAYPGTGLQPERLRDGWRMNTVEPVGTCYYIADDGRVLVAPADIPVQKVSSQLSAEFRRRHPLVDPPPAHDTGTDIFD